MKKKPSTVYRGYAVGRRVTVETEAGERELSPAKSQRLRNHSPDGFNWGYGGSGPAQLSLGILLDYYGDPGFAQRHYQHFKWEIIAGIQTDDWELTGEQIERTIGDGAAEIAR